ncbi:MAG: DNA polymerase III subunit beta [Magnetococcus sp. WYHC-3]
MEDVNLELLIAKEPFLKALSRLQSVVERRTTMPILAYARLYADPAGQLQLSATDTEVSLITACAADVELGGVMAVQARKLYEIVRELPDTVIRLRKDNNERLLLTCGRARFSLAGRNPQEFPELPQPDSPYSFTLPPGDLADMINKTHFAMSQDETRFTLNGLLFRLDASAEGAGGRLRLVSTDTHRLCLAERSLNEPIPETHEVILPRKAVGEAKKMLDESAETVRVVVGETYIQFINSEITLISKLVEGHFPNFERVLPENVPYTLDVDRSELQGVVRRMSVLSHEKSRGIRLRVRTDGVLSVDTDNPEQEAAEEEMSAQFNGPEPVTLGFNARYVQDIVSCISGRTVRVRMLGDESAVIVTDPEFENCLFVLMPMRV